MKQTIENQKIILEDMKKTLDKMHSSRVIDNYESSEDFEKGWNFIKESYEKLNWDLQQEFNDCCE